jgi:hypothetical protein
LVSSPPTMTVLYLISLPWRHINAKLRGKSTGTSVVL